MNEFVGKMAQFLIGVFKFHKKKLLTCLVAAVVFTLLLFPYGDLGDLVTAKVAEATGNQVFLQFEDLGIDVFPGPALAMKEVQVDTPNLPTIEAGHLTVAPSLASLLAFKMGFSASAEEMFRGDVDLSLSAGKNEDDIQFQNIDLSLENVDLKEATEVFPLSFRNPALPTPIVIEIKGKANLDLEGEVDPTFKNQPEAEVDLSIDQFKSGSLSVLGMNLPSIGFSKLNLKGRMSNGSFYIDEAQFGDNKDPLVGKIKGSLGLRFDQVRGRVVPKASSYELSMTLNASPQFTNDPTLGILLAFIDKFKRSSNKGATYSFKISGRSFGAQPRMQQISAF